MWEAVTCYICSCRVSTPSAAIFSKARFLILRFLIWTAISANPLVLLLDFYLILAKIFPIEFPSLNFCLFCFFSFLSLFPSFNVLLPLTPPNSALPKHFFFFYFCWLLLPGSWDVQSLSFNLCFPPTSSLFTNNLCFPLSFLTYFVLLHLQSCSRLSLPCCLVSSGHGAGNTQTWEALSSMVWVSVFLALAWGELICLCRVCGAWSALRAKRGGDGTSGELNFWNRSLLTVGKGSQFDFANSCLGLMSKLLLKDNSELWIVQIFAVAGHSEMW